MKNTRYRIEDCEIPAQKVREYALEEAEHIKLRIDLLKEELAEVNRAAESASARVNEVCVPVEFGEEGYDECFMRSQSGFTLETFIG